MVSEVLKRILPIAYCDVIFSRLNIEKLYEIRIRAERPITINYGGTYYFLGSSGIKAEFSGAFFPAKKVLNDIMVRACENSLYAFNDRICNGFLTLKGGMRIGIGGEIVMNNREIKTIKNFNSLNVRIPHEVFGCATAVYDYTFNTDIKNTLIVSPPGAGKTTILRDLARIYANRSPITNVLLVDERCELAAVSDGIAQLDVGVNADIISNCSKEFAFSQGIRALKPDIIITDELYGNVDIDAVEYACACGVKVFASVHAFDHFELINKPGFDKIVNKRLFSRYVCLSSRRGPGTLDGVFDESFESIYSKT